MLARRASLGFLVLGLAGCFLGPSPVTVGGSWSGQLDICFNQWNCAFSMDLRESSDKLSGSWSSLNNTKVAGTISGKASSSKVEFTLTPSDSSYCSYNLTAPAKGTVSSMSGHFSVSNCPGFASLSGSFTASK